MLKAAITVSSKGQIVLPVAIRKAAKVEKGDLLLMEVVGNKIVLTPFKRGLSPETKEERIRLLKKTAGALPGLDPGYIAELRKASAERLDRMLP